MTDVKLEEAADLADLLADKCECLNCRKAAALLRKIPELQARLSKLDIDVASQINRERDMALRIASLTADLENTTAKFMGEMRQRNELLRQLSERTAQWQPIETAPESLTILLFAVTDRDAAGAPLNWKTATGYRVPGTVHKYENETEWQWDGRRVKTWDIVPTHWMPLPGAPL